MTKALSKLLAAVPYLGFCMILHGAPEHPELLAIDVVNAADHSGGKVTPGEIVVLFPSNAGPATLAGASANSSGRISTLLGATRVLFDGIPAPMAYSIRGQIAAVVPYEIANRKRTIVVVEYEGSQSQAVTLPVAASAPGVFTLNLSGRGQAAMLNETGCCNSANNPAVRGAIVTLYATGEGQTRPRGVTGTISSYPRVGDYPVPRLPVEVMVGGIPAHITYAGEAPHAVAGLLQVNFRVPRRAPLGDAIPVVLKVGKARSVDGITMAVRSAVQRVLVVEGDAAARKRLVEVLAGAGYSVSVAQNVHDALRHANEHLIDLFILDFAVLQEENRKRIYELQKRRPQMRVSALVERLGPETLRTADLFGAQAIITYGMPKEAVVRHVREVLRLRPVEYSAQVDTPPIPLHFPLLH